MVSRVFIPVLFLFCAAACIAPRGVAHAAETLYGMLKKVEDGDTSVDFLALRRARVASPRYKPITREEERGAPEIHTALEEEDFKKCAELADEIVEDDPISLRGHFSGMICDTQLGATKDAAHHKWVVEGVLNAISRSGDGNTPDTALFVTNLTEVFDFLSFQKFKIMEGKLMAHDDGRHFFRMGVVKPDEPDRVYNIFFDVTAPYNAGQRTPMEK